MMIPTIEYPNPHIQIILTVMVLPPLITTYEPITLSGYTSAYLSRYVNSYLD